MRTDFHSHVLPGIDDGAPDTETSLRMLAALKEQRVAQVYATPHFHLHKRSVPDFSAARQKAYDLLTRDTRFSAELPRIYTAAEVAIEPELSRQDCRPLRYEGHPAILLELPGTEYREWMGREIENIRYGFQVRPVLAHLERYLWYERSAFSELLHIPDAVVQINAGSFAKREVRRLIEELYERRFPVLIGTDAHNCGSRAPNFDVAEGTLKKLGFRKWVPWIQKTREWFLSQTAPMGPA